MADKIKRRSIVCKPCGWERVVPDGVDVEAAKIGHSFDATGDGFAHDPAVNEDAGENVSMIEEIIVRTGAAWIAGARSTAIRDAERMAAFERLVTAEKIVAESATRANEADRRCAAAEARVAEVQARVAELNVESSGQSSRIEDLERQLAEARKTLDAEEK